ncbi:helix-turn-helix domain-containing protein [Paenibacillus thalictri]|uniref:Helix-turn-helix domain-containing protein n=1 Tax=Paenibacillus thalictri TaxID=2527873 RepID=A0A4Q9DN51_9BACL|nr:helix-turn-helix domain-containing protein [Paenibacillus thalictri]TBL74638.1 helix-turn-helix domain-containing protein [Paenibacillus thalictri]
MIIADEFMETDEYDIDRPEGMAGWQWLVCYTISGEGVFSTPQTGDIACKAGDMTLLRSGSPHRYRTQRGKTWRFVWAHYDYVPQSSYFADNALLVCPIETGHRRKRVFRTFKNIIHHTRERSVLWSELCELQIGELLLFLAEQRKKTLDPRVEQIMHLLTLRMKESVRIEELASALGLSASRMSHLFKEQTGQSVLQALTEMRLRQAALLLEHSGRTAAEVAYDVGYEDYNHFASQFRRRFGASPRDYIKSRRRDGT